jgi:branched-chain amino acid transport system substrate-binding protein
MNRNTPRRVAGLISVAAAFLCLFNAAAFAETIKIGVVAPYSGDLASYGVPAKNAAELAVKDINAAGGVLGKQLELVAEDDVCEPNTAANVANKLVSEGVKFVVGHLCSGATKAALPVYKNAGVIAISAASTNEDLTLGGGNSHFFRTIPHDGAQAQKQVDFATRKLGVKKAGVVHDKGDYGKGLAELVRARLENAGVEVVLFEGVTPGAPDYSALVAKFRDAGVSRKGTAVFFGGYHPEASKIVTAARKKRNNAYFISGDGVKDPVFVETAGRYALDYYATSPTDTSSLPKAVSVAAAYQGAYGEEPGNFSYTAYAAVQAFAAAMARAGGTDAAKMQTALREIVVDSPLGLISFDKNGDVLGSGFQMFQVQTRFVPAE